jgi:hypothetical protein
VLHLIHEFPTEVVFVKRLKDNLVRFPFKKLDMVESFAVVTRCKENPIGHFVLYPSNNAAHQMPHKPPELLAFRHLTNFK